jgi:hypothetical protein
MCFGTRVSATLDARYRTRAAAADELVALFRRSRAGSKLPRSCPHGRLVQPKTVNAACVRQRGAAVSSPRGPARLLEPRRRLTARIRRRLVPHARRPPPRRRRLHRYEGRNDDVIISAGCQIGPFEVESALVAHPKVVEAAAVTLRTAGSLDRTANRHQSRTHRVQRGHQL